MVGEAAEAEVANKADGATVPWGHGAIDLPPLCQARAALEHLLLVHWHPAAGCSRCGLRGSEQLIIDELNAVEKDTKEVKADMDVDVETDARMDAGLRHQSGGEVGETEDDKIVECGCRLARHVCQLDTASIPIIPPSSSLHVFRFFTAFGVG